MNANILCITIVPLLLCGCDNSGVVNSITSASNSNESDINNDVSYTSYNGNIYTSPVDNNNEDVSYSSVNGQIIYGPVL